MSIFEPVNALEAFRRYLNDRGLDEVTLTLLEGCEAMFGFYEDTRANGCDFQDADMLLFQWGTYDRAFLFPRESGTDEAFVFGLARQLILDEASEDDDIWQLELSFAFEPTDQLTALGRADKWCHSWQELPQFREHVLWSTPFTACRQHEVLRTTLEYGCAG